MPQTASTLAALEEEQTGYHFNVMRRAIELIDEHAASGASGTLTLDALAAKMQMSPAHFQRVFSKWAGVSPKKFQQYLTLGHAKALLDARFTTLATADSVGLSGSGRLHDLFLTWEAMSPGDYARRGKNLQINYAWVDTPFGDTLIAATDRGICGLAFSAEIGRNAALSDMTSRWPDAIYTEDPTYIATHADAVVNKTQTRLHLMGAPFQIKVWEALLSVPSGHVTTYSQIAGSIGNPKAVRAVGTAVGRNPISWLIPCHRALRKSGGLGGYHWGLPVKRAMLAYEAAQLDAGGNTRC